MHSWQICAFVVCTLPRHGQSTSPKTGCCLFCFVFKPLPRQASCQHTWRQPLISSVSIGECRLSGGAAKGSHTMCAVLCCLLALRNPIPVWYFHHLLLWKVMKFGFLPVSLSCYGWEVRALCQGPTILSAECAGRDVRTVWVPDSRLSLFL